jgi:hypothetical protein
MPQFIVKPSNVLFGTIWFVEPWIRKTCLQIGSDMILVVTFIVFTSPFPYMNFAVC